MKPAEVISDRRTRWHSFLNLWWSRLRDGPRRGRHILAQWDDERGVVYPTYELYQANFLWLMLGCGWRLI
jgi:hypothetical protein